MPKESPSLFSGSTIRRLWDDTHERWFFSVVDVVGALTEASDPLTARKYWNKLSQRLREEGSEVVTKCHQLKMIAADGKKYLTDCADTETLFRLIQSIPSPKAEPFKMWLAQVGHERIEEMEDPELSMDRAMETYLKKGYSREWINQRLKSIEVRKELTDEWENRGVKKGDEFALLTDGITRAWSGRTVREYKKLKNLKKENLSDNMTNLELVLNILAEASTAEISKKKQPKTLPESQKIAREGGTAARRAREEIERQTGESIVTPKNARVLGQSNKKLK